MELRDQDRLYHVDNVIRAHTTPLTLKPPPEDVGGGWLDIARFALGQANTPTTNLDVRAADTPPPDEYTAAEGRLMVGYPIVFNEWTRIQSFWEGEFLERIDSKAANKTIADKGSRIVPFFDHGFDPEIGYKPIGITETLKPDDDGVWAEAALLAEGVYQPVDAIAELIRIGGLFGQSFRFRVLHDEWVDEPDPSESNPKGLAERTIREMEIFEYGPVTWPAYEATTVGLRDDRGRLLEPVRTRAEFDAWRRLNAKPTVVELIERSRLSPAQLWAARAEAKDAVSAAV